MNILQKASVIKKYSQGESVVEKSSLDTDMYIVLEGALSLRVYDGRNDKIIAKKVVSKGAFFGGLGLTECYNRYITVTSDASSLLMLIPMKHVNEQRNYDRVNGEKLYQDLLVKAEGFNDEIRVMELEVIRKRHKKSSNSKHIFHYETPYRDIVFPEEGQKYLLDRAMKCPVCRESFETETIRTSRLQLKKRGEYFINEYKDVEPLWLDIVVCPSCYYAERIQFFEKLDMRDITELYQLLLDIKGTSLFKYSKPRNAEEVINAYLIYEKCLYKKNVGVKEKAKGAILMAELYRRLDSPGLAEVYYDKAFELYRQLIEAGVVDVDEMQMQQLYIILGKLYERKGMKDEAILQYKNAKTIFGVLDKRYTNIADTYLVNLTYTEKR